MEHVDDGVMFAYGIITMKREKEKKKKSERRKKGT